MKLIPNGLLTTSSTPEEQKMCFLTSWVRSRRGSYCTRGRPKSSNPKVALTIRYDAEVIESFRATGPGWQTRMNSALREWLTLKH